MDGWVAWVVGAAGFVVALSLLIGLAHRSLTAAHRDGNASSGGADAFGGLIEVFEPGRARADKELESAKHQATVTPSADDGHPVRVDLRDNTVRIRRPGAAPTPPGAE